MRRSFVKTDLILSNRFYLKLTFPGVRSIIINMKTNGYTSRSQTCFLYLLLSLLITAALYAPVPAGEFESEAEQRFKQGVEYFNRSLLKSAEFEFQQAVMLDPNLAAAYYNLGVISHLRGNLEEALEHYKCALKISENDPQFHYNLGMAYFQLNDYQRAIEHFEMTTVLDRGNAEAFYRLSIVYGKSGYKRKSREAYNQSIRINPEIKKREYEPIIASGDDYIAGRGYQKPPFDRLMIIPHASYRGSKRIKHDFYFSRFVQFGIAGGPSFPENYFFKLVSNSPDRFSYAGHITFAFPQRRNFLGGFGGDGFGFSLRGRYTAKKTGENEWRQYSGTVNLKIYENLDSRGRGKFFISFGPGIYYIKADLVNTEEENFQYGVEGGAGFDYLVIPFVSLFGEASYAFCYSGSEQHTNSLGYVHFGFSIHL